MDFELDFSSENSTMTSFLELEQEIREAPLLSEPLVSKIVLIYKLSPLGQGGRARRLEKYGQVEEIMTELAKTSKSIDNEGQEELRQIIT